MRTTHRHNNSGFTLIELMVVLAIVAIVAIAGVPSMYSMIASNRLASQSNELIASINLARSEAIKRGGQIVLCQSDNGSECNNDTEWGKGWMIFVSPDDTFTLGETIIRMHSTLHSSVTLTYTGTEPTISYSANGRKTGNEASFRLSDNESQVDAHIITVEISGRAKSEIEQSY